MPALPIPHLRLVNQLIAGSTFQSPVDVVRWMGAVQAQDYPAAKWAVGLRAQGATDATIEEAFNAGDILRTHVLRPTWHFVTAADIRWLLALTAPRIKAASIYYMRRLELDPPALSLANSVMEKALQGGKQLTRAQLELFLVQAGVISAADPSLRFLFVLMNAELEGVICSGARRGKQHTYALLEERAPAAKLLARDEAIPELARRYFASRGPATLKDFTWWSGLSGMDATTALAMIKPQLTELNIAGQTYWLDPSSQSGTAQAAPAVYLLPNYDEYVVSYADRSAIYDLAIVKQVDARGNFLFNHTIVIDGQVMGTWKRDLKKGEVIITPNLFIPLSKMQNQALVAEMDRYARFLEMPFRVETVEGSIK